MTPGKPLAHRRCSGCGAAVVLGRLRSNPRCPDDKFRVARYACTCGGEPPLHLDPDFRKGPPPPIPNS